MSRDDPLGIIFAERDDQRLLCHQLEEAADRLPIAIDKATFEEIYTKLKHKLPIYNRNEEALYSLLAANVPKTLDYPEISRLVSTEHRIHDCFADEFHEIFHEFGKSGHKEHCGYMLRYFFETIERHLDWEDLILMPYARRHLRKMELRELAAAISRNSALHR